MNCSIFGSSGFASSSDISLEAVQWDRVYGINLDQAGPNMAKLDQCRSWPSMIHFAVFCLLAKLGGHFGPEKKYLAPPPHPHRHSPDAPLFSAPPPRITLPPLYFCSNRPPRPTPRTPPPFPPPRKRKKIKNIRNVRQEKQR